MRLRFTKMQGAGNDFVMLDATRQPLNLSTEQYRALADRHFGIGADQILVVEPPRSPGVDFGYRIYNASGDEVEHCGNGARCFVRFVRDRGLTDKRRIRVETVNRQIELQLRDDGRDHRRHGGAGVRARTHSLPARGPGAAPAGQLRAVAAGADRRQRRGGRAVDGQPACGAARRRRRHAPMSPRSGPEIEVLDCFPQKVNAGFMQVISRTHIALRVFERGAGETLACGTGACAAVVAGIRLGWLDPRVEVDTRGGRLSIEWAGMGQPVLMTGPAATVFEGEIEL